MANSDYFLISYFTVGSYMLEKVNVFYEIYFCMLIYENVWI